MTFVLALGAAGVGALLAGALRISPVIGYIAAGLVIGPHTPGFVADIPTVEDLADVGVALLMFAVGVQLSFGDLRQVGKVTVIGGNIQVLLMIGIGYLIGLALGWGWLESLFLGAVLSNSSSTVISKVLADRGKESSQHARIALGWSTVQDIGTVVLVVLLATLASDSGDNLALEVAKAVGLAALFLALVVPAGIYLLPRFFDLVAKLGNQEIFVLSAVSIALGVAFLATLFGVSIALGAFVGGMLVGRSDLSHEVLQQVRPLRDIFAALFFVSVGMLVDPELLVDNLHIVALVGALIVIVKSAISSGLILAFGYRARTALAGGILLGQCAEFSFLMARVGADSGGVSDEVFGLLLAGSVLSILLAPATYAGAFPAGVWLERRLPAPRRAVPEEAPIDLSGHIILCGFGRVGRVIGDVFGRHGLPWLVVEQDPSLVQELRDAGVPALLGSASNETMLGLAGIDRARALVIATPDPVSTRRLVELARQRNPGLDIVARTHSYAERGELESRGADEAVVGELELALEMSRHALRRFGVETDEAEVLLDSVREGTRPGN